MRQEVAMFSIVFPFFCVHKHEKWEKSESTRTELKVRLKTKEKTLLVWSFFGTKFFFFVCGVFHFSAAITWGGERFREKKLRQRSNARSQSKNVFHEILFSVHSAKFLQSLMPIDFLLSLFFDPSIYEAFDFYCSKLTPPFFFIFISSQTETEKRKLMLHQGTDDENLLLC